MFHFFYLVPLVILLVTLIGVLLAFTVSTGSKLLLQ